MFNCEMCLKPTGPSIAPVRLVTQRRSTSYAYRPKANRPNPNHPKYPTAMIDDAGGAGWEVVREVNACRDCAGMVTELRGAKVAA